ncbi:MAG: hypothetical protein ABI696_09325, partial [Rubrivivax sp.]
GAPVERAVGAVRRKSHVAGGQWQKNGSPVRGSQQVASVRPGTARVRHPFVATPVYLIKCVMGIRMFPESVKKITPRDGAPPAADALRQCCDA